MSDARNHTAPKLQRVAFTTSRLAEFCGAKELTAQTGHEPGEWPLVLVKEVIDNALDACEEAEIAPEISIEVSTGPGEIVISDNGPGLPVKTLGNVLDYTVRVSSREAYVSSSRGQQGNALKCIIAMPFALDGTRGDTVIESQGQAHRIVFEMDPVRREPKVMREIAPSNVQTGTRITMHWPEKACHLLAAAEHRFVQTVCNFTTFNPHLTIRARWNGEEFLDLAATDRQWRKWRTCDPTSAHWYGVEQFERYMAAHIARDQDQGRSGRTTRDFIAELRGLARSGKQRIVLAETGTSGVPLATPHKAGEAGGSRTDRHRASAGGLFGGRCCAGELQMPQAPRHEARRPALRDRGGVCVLPGWAARMAAGHRCQFFGRDRQSVREARPFLGLGIDFRTPTCQPP